MEKSKFYSIVEYVAATPRSKRKTGTAAGGGSIIVGSDAGGTGAGEDGGSHAHANWELLERLGEQERYLTLKEENPDYYDLTDMEGRENIFSLSDMEQGTLDAQTGVPAESDTCLRSKSFRLVSGGHISVNSFGGRWMFLWLFYDAERTYINTAAEAAWITTFPHVAVLPENAAYVKFLITRSEVAAGEPDDTALTPTDAKADCRITVEMTDSPSSSWYPSAADYDPNTAPYLREKIKAGYADKAGIAEMAEDAKKWDGHLFNDYIDQPVRTTDEVRHKAVIGSFRTPDFAGGMTGLGGRIDEQGDGELESLILRRSLTVPEYNFNRVEISVGDDWSAPGGGVIAAVDTAQQLVTLKLEEGEWGAVAVDDICMGIFHSFDTSENASADRDDSRGNRAFAGFATSYFRITEVLGDHHEQFKYELRPVSASHTAQVAPSPAMKFVAYGSFRDASRRTSRYSTRVYQRYLRGVDDWEFKADNIAAQYGDLSNLAVFGLQMAGYSAYLDNIYMQGLLRSLDGTFVIDTKTKSLLMASAVTGVGMVFNPLQGLKIGTVYDPETGRFQKEYDIVQLDQTASNAEQTANEAHQVAEEAARRAQEAKDYIDNTLPEEFAQINRKLDGVVENWFYPYTPTSENEPAASWISGGTQAEHEGDTFTNTQVWVDAATTPDAGKSWRWIKDGTEYKWTLIADSDAVKALQQAAKAQAAADSKIRNFVVTPTPPYEVGDFWSQGAAGEIMRCIKARTSGSFDAADWVAAGDYHAYTDEKVTGKLTVIDASALDQDTYYPVTIYVREKFVRSKIAVRVSLDAPQPSIPAWATHPWGFSCYAIWSVCGSGWGADKENRIIEDFQYSWATKEPIGSIGQLMKSSLEYIYVRGGGVYKFYVTNDQAPKLRTETFTLEGESLELRTSVERPISLQEQADTAKAAANQAFSAVSSLKNFTDTAFADGIVDRAEAAAIEKYINSVKETQDAVKASYTTVYGNSLLAGSAKSNLASAKTAFDTAVTNLLSAISSAISDGVATTAERTAVNDKYALFNTAYGTYTSRLEEAQKYITDQIKAKADAAQAAADAAKAAAEAAKTTADSASSAVASLKDFTDTAFADGIVDRAEAAAIEKYINSVKETQDAVKASYTTVYGNSMLSSTAKSNLRSAKTAFDTAVTNLLTAISDAIKDGKATTAERTAVNDKYALFNTAYGTYTTRLEEAQKYITDQIKAKADEAYELSQDLQTAVSRLNDTIIPELQSQLDKQIVSWNGTAVPTLSNAPASDWTTTAERERHLGDYYDRKVTGGYERYKFVYEGNVYKWQLMADSEAAAAQSKAIEALGVAGSKNKVYFGDTTPAAPYAVNDLWVKTSGELYICNKNVQSGDSAADWKLVNDAQLRLRQMSSDSVISKEEKAVLRNTLTQMGEEMAEYYNDVAEYGVDISELEAAYSQLVSFLENTVAVKSDTDTTLTSQNLSVYNALFAAYDVAVSRFAAAVAAAMAAEQVGDVGYLKALFPATAEVDGAVIAQMLAVKNDAGTQVTGFLNGSSKFSDATHGICMIAMGMSSVTGWSSAKTRLYADGYFETSNASITGKITAETGKIGPFEIEVFNLRASTPTDILSLSASRINFSGATCDVFVGTSTYMEIMGAGLVGPVVVKEYRSTSLSYAGNVGICIDVKGAGLNDSYTKSGNHALYITSGTVTGLRLKNRRVSSNLTLDDMDCLVIIDSDAAKRTITLPASPKDGQFYIIRNIGTKGVTLQGNGKQIVLHTQGAWVSSDSWTNRDARYMVYSQIVGAWIMSA